MIRWQSEDQENLQEDNCMDNEYSVDPALIFREVLEAESGKEHSDLRFAYASEMAERIRERMPQLDICQLDFDAFFDCAVESMRPVQLKIENSGIWYAAAIDIPAMIERACEELDTDKKLSLCQQCMTAAATNQPFQEEYEENTYICSAIPGNTPQNPEKLYTIKKFFAAVAVATACFLAPLEGKADILGTTPIFATEQSAHFQKELLRGKNDMVFTQNEALRKQMNYFYNMKDKPLAKQIDFVNAFWNRFAYRSDQDVYNDKDHWATPGEFLSNKGGDCEDFALIKYWTLRKLGVPAENMSILVGQRLDRNETHAVLSVKDDKGKTWILDNLLHKPVSEDKMYSVFVPKYQISEKEKKVCVPNERLKTDLKKLGINPFEKETSMPASRSPSL